MSNIRHGFLFTKTQTIMKKFLMFALAMTMFAACGKDDENPKNPVVLTNPQAPYLLYWDGTRMQVGAWGTVTQENILFTQFGSAVAFTATSNDDTWDAGDVKFNPTAATYADYTTIPCWDGEELSNGSISLAPYHTLANVRAGLGDICKLAGLTAGDIANGHYDNSRFRLPTPEENDAAGYNTMVGTFLTVDYGVQIGDDVNTFLPAAGYRRPSLGTSLAKGNFGNYWSSRPYSGMFFSREGVESSSFSDIDNGFAIRCMPQ
jgi:hypothetical protein